MLFIVCKIIITVQHLLPLSEKLDPLWGAKDAGCAHDPQQAQYNYTDTSTSLV